MSASNSPRKGPDFSHYLREKSASKEREVPRVARVHVVASLESLCVAAAIRYGLIRNTEVSAQGVTINIQEVENQVPGKYK